MLECLTLDVANSALITFIGNSVGLWNTREANSKTVAQIIIKCRIYPHDGVSVLLFSIWINPLNQFITNSGYRYRFRSGLTISHIPYMLDIKLYARHKQHIN